MRPASHDLPPTILRQAIGHPCVAVCTFPSANYTLFVEAGMAVNALAPGYRTGMRDGALALRR